MTSKLLKFFIFCYTIAILPFAYFTGTASLAYSNSVSSQTALVLGAGIICESNSKFNCRPSRVLKNRLDKALELYFGGKVDTILVSGNGNEVFYNETKVMVNYLLDNQVKQDNIKADYRGNSTFESCKNAYREFKLDSVVLVTQAFHMSRSVFICQSVGLDVSAQIAEQSNQRTTNYGLLREVLASWKALVDISFRK
ncbi:MAG: ElyC/SanA/YdcF family protein [Patescibacteria group bacterium]